ncbi:zinc finger protein 518B [Chaetodon trifascialis]|uniref:zinc finger protein 518B n=1 Tax=Chaetodon trifascialis TaxID=109706 RepID=UPI003994A922
MKPVSYQSMPSSVSAGHPALDRVLSTSNVMHCEKCGFATPDAAVFKKHMIEHTGTRFYCFYCNNVSFSEAELNAHLRQHTAKYPFKCPHCGQGYMRRLCLVKHIERLHSKGISYGPAKPGMTKIPHVPVSSALPSVPTADPSSLRPVVRVTVPTPSAPVYRLGKDEHREKTLDTNVSNATNGNAELLSPLNGLIQHNRALTVSLPEEVTIPAGCLVELVEVKTVNGTKELKLRLVSQQENESVIKDTRTTVSQNSALGKQLSSTLNHPNTSLGMCTISRKQYETKAVNVEHPAVLPVSISQNLPNQISKEKITLKRTSQEIINLECHTVLPNKVPKSILNPVREGNIGIKVTPREPVNHNAALPVVASTRVTNRLTGILNPENMGKRVTQRALDERKSLILDPSKTVPPRRANDIKSIPQDVSLAVKLEPGEIRLKNSTASKIKTEALGSSQQSLKSPSPSSIVPLAATAQMRPPAISLRKDNVANPSFSVARSQHELPSFKTPVLSNGTKNLAWNQGVRSGEKAGERDAPEPEGFPVISSVFSLSQQPEDVQGSIQPLVMALRGIVMDKSNSSGSPTPNHIKIKSAEQVKEVATSGYRAQVATKDGSFTRDLLLTKQTSESVKAEEHHKGIQHPPTPTPNHAHVKEDGNTPPPKDDSTRSHTPDSKPSTDQESVSKIAAYVDVSGTAEPLQQMAKSEHDISSRFLTVSLKRVQVGVWKKNKKGLKLRISKYKTQVPMSRVTDCTVIYPMPLKVDQLVKRPGPNQPVVVLNHPKPRASLHGARADTLADTGPPEVVPKCQILKMRLSKVMGQKYEVMGCTVGVFP